MSTGAPEMRRELAAHGFSLVLHEPGADAKHTIRPLAVKFRPGDGAAQLYFSCCGQPMMVLVLPRASKTDWGTLPFDAQQAFQMARPQRKWLAPASVARSTCVRNPLISTPALRITQGTPAASVT